MTLNIKIFNEFTRETKDELWNSDTEMVKHYKQEKNFQKLNLINLLKIFYVKV